MDLLMQLMDLLLHLDKHLAALLTQYGTWIYVILFLIIFCETGLVVMPFLPGDSLLFVAGALWAASDMNPHALVLVLVVAAILGDTVNYAIGNYLGPKVFHWEDSRWFNRKALDRTHAFYEKHGGVTIIAARFFPFIRTFAPFAAGVAHMDRLRFTLFIVSGAVLWVVGVGLIGYVFGNIPWVQQHFEKFIWALIILPGLLSLWAAFKSRQKPQM